MNESEMNDVNAKGRTGSSSGITPEAEKKTARAVEKERVFIGTGLFWGLVVGVLLAVIMIILAAQNTKSTTIKFLVWEYSTPLIVVILAVLLVGVVLDELVGLVYRARRRRTLTDRRELKRLKTKPR